ncbi:hypothetical protein PsorP6_004340 [Peronosclerospora sorghi]|uniref:Uncharacterized protein n=1 Tax=Peronosclerospora sorghi TaxID=230839 RepID=A0ACC0VNM7_9STRA|nr:hypothetical protein PsorP6_004340 [Peronosclerospora sorghi]
MESRLKLLLVLVAAAFLFSGNLFIIASMVDGCVPYSSVTVNFLIEATKICATLLLFTPESIPATNERLLYYPSTTKCFREQSQLRSSPLPGRCYSVRTLEFENLFSAVLFRYLLKHQLSELNVLAISLLILGVLTSQSDRLHAKTILSETHYDSQCMLLGLTLALVGVTLS